MLPIRWIAPIVGALFALALVPLAFNEQDTSRSLRNSNITSDERLERRQTIVRLGIQRSDDALKLSSRDLDAVPAAEDVTGSVETTSPVVARPVIKTPGKSTRHFHRRSRPAVHSRVKHARAGNNFGGQRAWHIPKQEFKFNAN